MGSLARSAAGQVTDALEYSEEPEHCCAEAGTTALQCRCVTSSAVQDGEPPNPTTAMPTPCMSRGQATYC